MSTIMENRALLAALELSMLNLNNTTYSTASPDPPNGLFDESPDSPLSGSSKKSQNITQCVSVPTSEHVAEIVGRQGTFVVCDCLCSLAIKHLAEGRGVNFLQIYFARESTVGFALSFSRLLMAAL